MSAHVVSLVRRYTDTETELLGREVERLSSRLQEREDVLWRIFATAHLEACDGVSPEDALAHIRKACREQLGV